MIRRFVIDNPITQDKSIMLGKEQFILARSDIPSLIGTSFQAS